MEQINFAFPVILIKLTTLLLLNQTQQSFIIKKLFNLNAGIKKKKVHHFFTTAYMNDVLSETKDNTPLASGVH